MGFQQGSDLNTTSQPPNTQQMTLEVLNSCFPALGVVRNKAGRFGVFVETKQLQKMYKLIINCSTCVLAPIYRITHYEATMLGGSPLKSSFF